ncbi:MAG TPA: methyl-accepting chemotaxis protein [Spirochaetota bacterium]|nr:methyl-accepting chemotaxis protein [Spirochaetota bacterium]HPI89259.1 methyl-accepting chemotaxis protein [Spirochaetota bacterium]HPR48581.1 methyl-accepting chemotaxis protein [Spirochaetota bacterium]
MNSTHQFNSADLSRYEKDIKRFTFTFIASTEFISYFLIVPLLFIYIVVNLDFNTNELIRFLKICTVAFTVSLSTTLINNIIVVAPIVRYFKALLNNEQISQDEYAQAQMRFFNLPYYHGIGAFFRWILGLSMAFVPFLMTGSYTFVQKYNVWMLVAVIAPFGGILYFLLTELFIQKLLTRGVFPVVVINKMQYSMNFVKRIIISVMSIYLLPVLAIIGYFLLVLEHANPGEYFSFVRLAGIIFFGAMVAFTLGIALIKTIHMKITLIMGIVDSMAKGDFSADRQLIAVMDELTKVTQIINAMKDNVVKMLLGIKEESDRLSSSTDEISSIADSFSAETQNGAATVEEVTATMEEISASLESIASGAQQQITSVGSLSERIRDLSGSIHEMERMTTGAQDMAGIISGQVQTGEQSLKKMDESMKNISESSQKMTAIIGIINDISDKINLLSLNASIEAARAGEAGRGFAVVADEISKLADNTATSVKEIDTLIKNSEAEITQGKVYAAEVVTGMGKIIDGVEQINGMATGISGFVNDLVHHNKMVDDELKGVKVKSEEIERSTSEQKRAMTEVLESISRINELTQSISAGAEEIAANSIELATMADNQKGMVNRFKLTRDNPHNSVTVV